MTSNKINKAFVLAGVALMPSVREHIWRNVTASIPADVLESMTAKQIAGAIAAANTSWHDGKHSSGAEIVDGCLWINAEIGLIPIAALAAIKIEQSTEVEMVAGPSLIDDSYTVDGQRIPLSNRCHYDHGDLFRKFTFTKRTYILDYAERI